MSPKKNLHRLRSSSTSVPQQSTSTASSGAPNQNVAITRNPNLIPCQTYLSPDGQPWFVPLPYVPPTPPSMAVHVGLQFNQTTAAPVHAIQQPPSQETFNKIRNLTLNAEAQLSDIEARVRKCVCLMNEQLTEITNEMPDGLLGAMAEVSLSDDNVASNWRNVMVPKVELLLKTYGETAQKVICDLQFVIAVTGNTKAIMQLLKDSCINLQQQIEQLTRIQKELRIQVDQLTASAVENRKLIDSLECSFLNEQKRVRCIQEQLKCYVDEATASEKEVTELKKRLADLTAESLQREKEVREKTAKRNLGQLLTDVTSLMYRNVFPELKYYKEKRIYTYTDLVEKLETLSERKSALEELKRKLKWEDDMAEYIASLVRSIRNDLGVISRATPNVDNIDQTLLFLREAEIIDDDDVTMCRRLIDMWKILNEK